MLKAKKYFQNYEPGKALVDAFDNERIPILQMAHLRELDFPISRHISYERTVDEFLLQMGTNVALQPLVDRKDMIILLNEEGALVSDNGKWSLLFTPNRGERDTLADDADLYPVYKSMLEKEKEGTMSRVRVPERSMKALVAGIAPFCILDEYCANHPGGYLNVAEQIVYAGPEELFKHVPVCHFNKLTTVDMDEIESYHSIRSLFEDYIIQYDQLDPTETLQPLSIAVFGPPGSGKSFGVKQIAATCERFETSSLNLSQYSSAAEMFEALDEALSCQKGRIPLIFFDEFDSDLNGKNRGWLKYFLAPMQDGEYTLRGKTRIVGSAVFVFAGGTASAFNEFQPSNAEEEEIFRSVKGPDFVSRLKGVLNIKGLNPVCPTDRSHIIRRAMLLRTQIMRRVPGIYNEDGGLINISRGLLSSLLRVSEYRHGARSLEFILGMCRLSNVRRFTPSCLPLQEQLDIHLDVADFHQKLTFEQVMGDMVDKYAQTAHENYREKKLESARKKGYTDDRIAQIGAREDMVKWNDLKEIYKESYRSKIRYLGECLESYTRNIGLRPIVPDSSDSISELYGPVLEEIAELEHKRWVRDKIRDGWRYGDRKDEDMKLTPELVDYGELSAKTKEAIRKDVRDVPMQLREIGYELYYKSY